MKILILACLIFVRRAGNKPVRMLIPAPTQSSRITSIGLLSIFVSNSSLSSSTSDTISSNFLSLIFFNSLRYTFLSCFISSICWSYNYFNLFKNDSESSITYVSSSNSSSSLSSSVDFFYLFYLSLLIYFKYYISICWLSSTLAVGEKIYILFSGNCSNIFIYGFISILES